MRCLLVFSIALSAFLAITATASAYEADFNWSPDPAIVTQRTTFTAVEDPSVAAYGWDLDGNGSYGDASGPQVPRTFNNVRTYEVGLLTLLEGGGFSERRKEVPVVQPGTPGNKPPEASFVFFPAGPVAGELVTFVSTSTDPDSAIPPSALRWDLNGDDVFEDAEGASATTSFPAAGTYTVSLRIATNATDVATLVLNVGAPGAPGANVGQRALSLLSPFPLVRIAGRTSHRGVRIRRLTVTAPPGTSVKLRCGGPACPFKRVLQKISTRVRANRILPPTRLLRIRRVEGRLLRPGVTLQLFVTRADAVGKYTRFRILRGKPPARRDRCLVPGNGHPIACP